MKGFTTFPGLLKHVSENYGFADALNGKVDGKWQPLSTHGFVGGVEDLALGLHQLGIDKGDTVGIVGLPSPAWVTADLAIMTIGAVSVPFFPLNSESALQFKAADSAIRSLIVLQQEDWPGILDHIDLFDRVVTYDFKIDHAKAIDGRQIVESGREERIHKPHAFESIVDRVDENDLATIIYTSGSTGTPKGVELTHKNLMSQIHSVHKCMHTNTHDVAVSCLPLAHCFERMIMYSYISSGVRVYINNDIHELGADLKDVGPTVMTVVPRILEKVYAKLTNRIDQRSALQRTLGRWALAQGHGDHEDHHGVSELMAEVLLFSKMRASMGGNLRCMVTGGAALQRDLYQFFTNAGIPLFQGYGLTEASPVLCANYPDDHKIGTVGKPFPDVEVHLAETGEILARGPNIMRGYHNRPEETARTVDQDGWLHTGDLGVIDSDGYVSIIGRIKEQFKTSRGEYVAPTPIEHALASSPLIDTSMIIGDGQPFVTCLLFPDMEYVEMRIASSGEYATCHDFLKGEEMREEMETLIQHVNQMLKPWERIESYRIVASTISVETGELTPTMKLRRHIIVEKYKALIQQMYDEQTDNDIHSESGVTR